SYRVAMPRRFRWVIWSAGCGMIARMPRHLRRLDHPAPTGCSVGPYELAA
ncbi:MAG: hypothetical protein QOF84_4348, partial [Streptomyces sp.]|nr:hypothetical protein [Streptomyces sp.]